MTHFKEPLSTSVQIVAALTPGTMLLSGTVELQIEDLIGHDMEDVLDLISEKMTGTTLLAGIEFRPLAVGMGDKIILEVTGDVGYVLDFLSDVE